MLATTPATDPTASARSAIQRCRCCHLAVATCRNRGLQELPCRCICARLHNEPLLRMPSASHRSRCPSVVIYTPRRSRCQPAPQCACALPAHVAVCHTRSSRPSTWAASARAQVLAVLAPRAPGCLSASQISDYSLLLPAASCCLRVPAIGGCPEGQAYSPAIQVPNATFSAQSTAQSVWISSRPPSSISQARGGAPGRSQKTQENHALSASYWHLRMVQYSARTDVPPTRGGVRGFLSVCTSLGVWPNPRRSSLTTAPCRAAGGGGAGPYDVSMCGSPE